jgi:hypothetical protein
MQGLLLQLFILLNLAANILEADLQAFLSCILSGNRTKPHHQLITVQFTALGQHPVVHLRDVSHHMQAGIYLVRLVARHL